MRSLDDLLLRLQALQSAEPEAVVDALCRVDASNAREGGTLSSITRLVQELGTTERRDEHRRDFGTARNVPLTPQVDPRDQANASNDRDRVTRALLATLESYQALLERHRRDFDEVFERRQRGEAEDEDDTIRRLREAQVALLKYPVAAQAAFAAMVREGRRFAATDDGQAWKRRLAGSAMLAKARTLFEGLSGGLLVEDGAALPSTYVDGFLQALDRSVEEVLGDLGGAGKLT